MSEAWVVNASPLILFVRIGRLDLIEHLARMVLIPNAVFEEVRHGQQKDITATTALEWAEKYRVLVCPGGWTRDARSMAGSRAGVFSRTCLEREKDARGTRPPRAALQPSLQCPRFCWLCFASDVPARGTTQIDPMVALSWMLTAFSPRKQAITLYLSSEFKERDSY